MIATRREFIQTCIVAPGTTAVAVGNTSSASGVEPLTNWAGNYRYSATRLHRATSVDEVREFVRRHDRLKVLGTRHCFNGIADSRHRFLSLAGMNQTVALEKAARTVMVEAGMKYGELSPSLHEQGFALHNMASLPHISVAGACATATHGSGVAHGNLATAVTAMEIVIANGDLLTFSKATDPAALQAAVVNLGAVGVVTKVTLEIQPAFMMRQLVYLDMPMSQVKEHFDEISAAAYSVSLFTDWQKGRINEVWLKYRVDGASAPPTSNQEFFGGRAATRNVHPIVELSAEHCTEQLGVPGPWYERLPHFRMGFTPSSGKELQSEYFVDRRNAVDALLAVERLRDHISPHLQISELRTIDRDELWMSPCYRRPSLAIHFTWKQDWDAVQRVLPMIERELAPYGVRPHWGKLFTVPATELRRRYEQWDGFREFVRRHDPGGKFRNAFLSALWAD